LKETGSGEPVAARSPLLHHAKRHKLGHGLTPLGNQDLLTTLYPFQVAAQVGLQLGNACRLHVTILDRFK
jgi:hypothetical protein